MGRNRSSNDDRSDALNPNNPAYQHNWDNYSDQLNPNNERYQRQETDTEENPDENRD